MKSAIGIFEKISSFLRETRAELKKVVWPDRRYVTVATTIILVIVFLVGIFVVFVDFSFSKTIGYLNSVF